MRFSYLPFAFLLLLSSSHSSLHCTSILVVQLIPFRKACLQVHSFPEVLAVRSFRLHLCCDFQFTTFPPDYCVEILRFGHITSWTLPAVQGPPITTHL